MQHFLEDADFARSNLSIEMINGPMAPLSHLGTSLIRQCASTVGQGPRARDTAQPAGPGTFLFFLPGTPVVVAVAVAGSDSQLAVLPWYIA